MQIPRCILPAVTQPLYTKCFTSMFGSLGQKNDVHRQHHFATIKLRRMIAFAGWGLVGCASAVHFQAPPGSISGIRRICRPKSFHFLRKPHVMFHISRIKGHMCLRVFPSQIWPAIFRNHPFHFISHSLHPTTTTTVCALFILLQPRLV